MSLPLFYNNTIEAGDSNLILNEETSRHIVQVLRMKAGEQIRLTNGRGNLFTTEITDDHKKKTAVKIVSSEFIPATEKKVLIGISLLKNTSRFEWFLEKATEIGVNEIIPLICARTERQQFRFERMNGILISAMLQSQQSWLPVLHDVISFDDFTGRRFDECKKYIAHCLPEALKQPLNHFNVVSPSRLIVIGPEGDFTENEISKAIANSFLPVSLGETRLRTETAGVVASTLLRLYDAQ